MIFSDKIFILKNGYNATIFANSSSSISLFLYDNYLKEYNILTNSNNICVFNKMYNFDKIIKLNQNKLCICNNGCMNLININET